MPAKRKLSAETISRLHELYHSDVNIYAIGKLLGYDYKKTLRPVLVEAYGEQALVERFKRLCAVTKFGKSNPMFGKTGAAHHRWTPRRESSQGYWKIDAPEWYTGLGVSGRKVHEHTIVMCEKLGVTELPSHMVVHHKDGRKLNNHPDNLELLNRGSHMVTHRWMRHRKKVQRLSRKGVGPKQDRSAQRPEKGDDIV